MIEQRIALASAFELISTYHDISIIDEKKKKECGFSKASIVWEIISEIHFENNCRDVIFHMKFTDHFPYDLPKIYLSLSSFESIGFIPHIDSNRFVCTFDPEIAITNPHDPAGIILSSLKRAKSIIEEGLSGANKSDFEDEFIAYWEDEYNDKGKSITSILSLIDSINIDKEVKLISLEKPLNLYNNILHQDDKTAITFKQFLEDSNYKYFEEDVFFAGDINIKSHPPFSFTNRDIIKLFSGEKKEQFVRYINNKSQYKLVLTQKILKNKEYLYGWVHNDLDVDINGFRPGKFKPFHALSRHQSGEIVQRFSSDRFTLNRLENRTAGVNSDTDRLSIIIAGLGSIGSNLIFFLNSLNYPEFKLVDKDVLRIENIGRHLLGFNYVGTKKTIAIKDFVKKSNPLQSISTKELSIINVLKDSPEYINSSDALIVAIGNTNIEELIGEALKEGLIKIPTIFLWVEPYLCGGHFLYINPSDANYASFFDNGLFKYNIIRNSEYESNTSKLVLKEAGCQTTFIPYSSSNIISFLSSIFPRINSLLNNKNNPQSVSYTWIGSKKIINERGIKLSHFSMEHSNGDLIENHL